MDKTTNPGVEKIIRDYLELKEMSRTYEKKRYDLEREYNKLLTVYHGSAKNYTLAQADKIYNTWSEMNAYEEKAKIADDSFREAENKLKGVGKILYESAIHAEISFPASNGMGEQTRAVTVTFNEGQVDVR